MISEMPDVLVFRYFTLYDLTTEKFKHDSGSTSGTTEPYLSDGVIAFDEIFHGPVDAVALGVWLGSKLTWWK